MNHEGCQANFIGSSGSIEVAGGEAWFARSTTRSVPVRYVSYLGDGDSKAFQSIEASEPYEKDVVISKLECVGHVQKRIGTRFCKLKDSFKKKT